jgi:hypothetical protein
MQQGRLRHTRYPIPWNATIASIRMGKHSLGGLAIVGVADPDIWVAVTIDNCVTVGAFGSVGVVVAVTT